MYDFDVHSGAFSFHLGITAEHRRVSNLSELPVTTNTIYKFLAISNISFEDETSYGVFERCVFVDCVLHLEAFSSSKFIACDFQRCRFIGIARDVVFSFCNFRSANGKGECSLKNVRARSTTFENSDLSQLDFAGVDLATARISHCRLIGANFTNSIYRSRAHRDIYFTSFAMTNSNCFQANFAGASMAGADLSGTDFSDCDMTRADLTGCDLRLCKFEATKVGGVLFDDADLGEASFLKVDLSAAQSWFRAKINEDQSTAITRSLGFTVRKLHWG